LLENFSVKQKREKWIFVEVKGMGLSSVTQNLGLELMEFLSLYTKIVFSFSLRLNEPQALPGL
jgi:hypothetical protein